MNRFLIVDWLRDHGRETAIDLGLAGGVAWMVFWPAANQFLAILQAGIVTAVLLRAYHAWREIVDSPQKLNTIWHRVGRQKGTETINRIARLQRLERDEAITSQKEGLGTALLHARQDLPIRCGLAVPQSAIDLVAEHVHGFWLPVDRSATLPSPGLRMAVVDPIPNASGFKKSFDEVCHQRAAQILAEDREIALFWSGGIDSTTALSALLMQADAADRARIFIFLRPRSISEYPYFFDNYVKILNHYIITAQRGDDYRSGTGRTFSCDLGAALAAEARHRLVVTGEHGDQIFGSMKLAENPDWIGQPAQVYLDHHDLNGHDQEIQRLNAACPVPIRTIETMLWWWNFAVKWQEITFRGLSDLRHPGDFSNIRHFFQTDDFQKWSIANPDLKIRHTFESYKWPAKDFIHAFTGDEDYRVHKTKVGSLRVRIGGILGIDDRYNVLFAGQTSTDDAKIAAKYGRQLHRFIAAPPARAA